MFGTFFSFTIETKRCREIVRLICIVMLPRLTKDILFLLFYCFVPLAQTYSDPWGPLFLEFNYQNSRHVFSVAGNQSARSGSSGQQAGSHLPLPGNIGLIGPAHVPRLAFLFSFSSSGLTARLVFQALTASGVERWVPLTLFPPETLSRLCFPYRNLWH